MESLRAHHWDLGPYLQSSAGAGGRDPCPTGKIQGEEGMVLAGEAVAAVGDVAAAIGATALDRTCHYLTNFRWRQGGAKALRWLHEGSTKAP